MHFSLWFKLYLGARFSDNAPLHQVVLELDRKHQMVGTSQNLYKSK